MSFDDALRAALPIQTDLYGLFLVDPAKDHATDADVPGIRVLPSGDTLVTLQLHLREEVGGAFRLRDIKEQEVVIVRAKHRDDPRVAAYVAGWCDAVRTVFTEQEALARRDPAAFERLRDRMDCLMPYDLAAPAVLDLVRPRDTAAFCEAFLSSKKRFGRFLP
jgi:hypothetical protein